MPDVVQSFRTITRCGIFRQVLVSNVLTLVPVAMVAPPSGATLNPGDNVQEVETVAYDGRKVIAFSYTDTAKPELQLEFGLAGFDLEAIIHGRVAATGTSVSAQILAEIDPTAGTPPGTLPARKTGEIGESVTAVSSVTGLSAYNRPYAYTIDPTTRLAKPVTIGDGTGTNSIQIGAKLATVCSADLVTAGNTVYVWTPCPVATATVLSGTPVGLMSIFMMGVSFDGTARMIIARNCQRLPGGSVNADPKRQLKFRILPDPGDGTGLGYSIIDTASRIIV